MKKRFWSYVFISVICLCALLACLGLAGAAMDSSWYESFGNFTPVVRKASIIRNENGTDILTMKAYMGEYGSENPEYEAFVFDENELKIDIVTIPDSYAAFDSSTNTTTITTPLYYMGLSDTDPKPAIGDTVNVSAMGVFWINGTPYSSKLAELYKVKLQGPGGTTGYDLSTATIVLANTTAIYTGRAIEPEETVTVGDEILVRDTDYTMSWLNNTDAGTGTAIATGTGENTGSINTTFVINARDLSGAKMTLANTTAVYTGSAIEPEETVMLDGVMLKRDVDYTMSYKNNINVGMATAVAAGKGNYSGTTEESFEITEEKAIDLSQTTITLDKTRYTYSGKENKPGVTVVWNSQTLTENNDYTVDYSNNVNAGTGTATVTGKGRFKGSVPKEFVIEKAANTIKISPTKKTLKYKILKKKTKSFKVKATVKGGAKVTYKLKSVPQKVKKYIKVSSGGKITVKKNIPKGKYKIKLNVTAKATKNYKKTTVPQIVTITIK